jgi:transcriptional regulator with XRE-family HTH domain
MLKVGNKIKKLRELKNFTQEYMAQNLNLSPNGYGKIERDEVDVTIGRLEEIAKILEVDIFQVMTFDEKQIFNFTCQTNQTAYGFVQSLQTNDAVQTLITQLQEENKYLRTQIQEFMSLLKNK